MNNIAVRGLFLGDYGEAIKQLEEALKAVSLNISCNASYPEANFSVDKAEKSTPDSNLPFCKFFCPSSSSQFREVDRGDSRTKQYVFQSPIFVTEALPMSDNSSYDKLSYIIVYNLGLAHHLQGLKSPSSKKCASLLYKAQRLYENSNMLLMKNSEILNFDPLNTMAILCNLGHIHSVLGSEETAQLCYQNLLSVLLYLVDCGHTSNTQYPLEGFFLNIMPIIAKPQGAPAA